MLVFLAARAHGRIWTVATFAYSLAMSISVVYLGEHYLIDVVMGWVVAIAGWRLAGGWRPLHLL